MQSPGVIGEMAVEETPPASTGLDPWSVLTGSSPQRVRLSKGLSHPFLAENL